MDGELIAINDTSNAGNHTSSYKYSIYSDKFSLMSQPEAKIVPIVFAVVFVSGLTGNITLLCYILRKRLLNSSHTVYVMNLAIGDILMILVAMPFVSIIYTLEEWPFGEIICKMSEGFQTLCTAVTILTITALSIERYLMSRSIDSTERLTKSKRIVLLIWVFSIGISIPDVASSTSLEVDTGIKICHIYNPAWGEQYAKLLTIAKIIILFIIPLFVTAFYYICIILNIKTSSPVVLTPSRNKSPSCTSDGMDSMEEEIRRRRQIALIVACLISIFVICWMPRRIYLMWYHFHSGPYTLFWHVFKITGFCLMFANSAANPYVFVFLETGFRRYLINCFLCRGNSAGMVTRVEEVDAPQQTMVLTELISSERNDTV